MRVGGYWVGQIPVNGVDFTIMDDRTNSPFDTTVFTRMTPRLIGPDNREIDLAGAALIPLGSVGRVRLDFPRDRSLFTRPGEYVFQLELSTEDGYRDMTSTATFVVRQRGVV